MCFCGGVQFAKDEQKPPSAEQPNSERRGGEEQGACSLRATYFYWSSKNRRMLGI